MSKSYDRKYVISLGDKNISKLKENIFNLIEYLSTNPYPPKFDDEDAGEVVISILDGLEKLINHMKINVLSNEDIERYESVLKDQSKDICCSNYKKSVINLTNSFESLQTRTRNREIMNYVFYLLPLLILFPFYHRVIYIPILFIPLIYLSKTLLNTNKIINYESDEEYKCCRIHELNYPKRKYQKPIRIITDDNLKAVNFDSKVREKKEDNCYNETLTTINEEEDEEDKEKEKEEVKLNTIPQLNINVQFYDDSNDESDAIEIITKTLLQLSQNKVNSNVPLLIPASLEKNLIDLINILEENEPEAETLKKCKEGLELLQKIKHK